MIYLFSFYTVHLISIDHHASTYWLIHVRIICTMCMLYVRTSCAPRRPEPKTDNAKFILLCTCSTTTSVWVRWLMIYPTIDTFSTDPTSWSPRNIDKTHCQEACLIFDNASSNDLYELFFSPRWSGDARDIAIGQREAPRKMFGWTGEHPTETTKDNQ